MLLISLATLALASHATVAPSAPVATAVLGATTASVATTAPVASAASAGSTLSEDHGKLAWFQGSYEDALKEAKAKNKMVFIDLWTTWCVWCKRLDKDTYSDDSVVAEMKDIICFNIDAESKAGAPLAKEFKVRGYPALILLSPDGTYRDQIGGYLKPEEFKREIQRVRSGKGTLTGLRQDVEADKANIDKRYALVKKLREMEDKAGVDAQMAEIQKLDPEGKSLPMHQMAFEKVIATITEGWEKDKTLDMTLMKTFLEKETYPEVLFMGWNSMMGMQNFLAQEAAQANKPEDAKKLRADLRQSMAEAWKSCSKEQSGPFGGQMANAYFQDKDDLTPAEKTLALDVARKALATAPENPGLIDVLACCLFMNGQKDEALKMNARCIELDPKNADWQTRKAEFSATK